MSLSLWFCIVPIPLLAAILAAILLADDSHVRNWLALFLHRATWLLLTEYALLLLTMLFAGRWFYRCLTYLLPGTVFAYLLAATLVNRSKKSSADIVAGVGIIGTGVRHSIALLGMPLFLLLGFFGVTSYTISAAQSDRLPADPILNLLRQDNPEAIPREAREISAEIWPGAFGSHLHYTASLSREELTAYLKRNHLRVEPFQKDSPDPFKHFQRCWPSIFTEVQPDYSLFTGFSNNYLYDTRAEKLYCVYHQPFR